MQCKLPFSLKYFTFHGCVFEKDRSDTPWCATETDRYGEFIEDKWGECGKNCIKHGKNSSFTLLTKTL